MNYILFYLLLTPFIPIFFLIYISKFNYKYLKIISLICACFIFIFINLFLFLIHFDLFHYFQFIYEIQISKTLNWFYIIGVDSLTILFLLLTSFLIIICILISWHNIKELLKEYFIILFSLELMLFQVFCILDIFFFYIFFEAILIPMFIFIGIWGSRSRKIYAAYQFFIYTLIGSLIFLIGILVLYSEFGTTNLLILYMYNINLSIKKILWILFFISFAIKIPLCPFHIWLPEAHVEAPTAGSVLLAGLLLKLGAYGFLRFTIPLLTEANEFFLPIIYLICYISIIYTSLITLRQNDLKKIIAYSSIGHMSLVILGLFSYNSQSFTGSIITMISHAFVSSSLFISIGYLYDRYHTRSIYYYNNLYINMPNFSIFFFFFILGNISFPGSLNFIGEFFIFNGLGQVNLSISILCCFSIILTGLYSIWVCNKLLFNYELKKYLKIFSDLSRKEFVVFFIFFINIFLWGLFPNFIIKFIEISINFQF